MIESYRNIYSKLEDIPIKYITAKQSLDRRQSLII